MSILIASVSVGLGCEARCNNLADSLCVLASSMGPKMRERSLDLFAFVELDRELLAMMLDRKMKDASTARSRMVE